METKLTLKHYLFERRGSTGSLPIYLRITYNRKKVEIHSGYSTTTQDWDPVGQLTKTKSKVNKELLVQKSKIVDFKIELEKNNKPVSATILKELHLGKANVQTNLLEYLGQYIEELKIKNEIKQISLNKYEQSKKTLANFIVDKYRLADVTIDKVTYEFINAYGLFLRQEYSLHKNTINKYHSRLRTILLRAQAGDFADIDPPFSLQIDPPKLTAKNCIQRGLFLVLKCWLFLVVIFLLFFTQFSS